MKLQIPTKALVAALATMKTITKPSTTHAILSNVCITADKKGITLLGMDLEKQLSIRMECAVKQTGSTTLSCAKLHDSLAKARGADCAIETNDKHETTIRVGTAVTKLRGLPPEEMPQPIAAGESFSIHIPASKLNSLLAKSLLHSATDKTKAILLSVCARQRGGNLSFQATNRNRAIMCDTGIAFDSKDSFIIPKESVPVISNMATEGEVELCFSDGALTAKTENCSFTTKLIDGAMPDFERVFPKDSPLSITANRAEFVAVIEYAQVQSGSDLPKIKLTCDGKTLTAQGQGVNNNPEDAFFDTNEDTMPVGKDSAEISFNINPQFLRDSLKCMEGDTVKLEMTTSTAPIIIKEEGIICMICPMV